MSARGGLTGFIGRFGKAESGTVLALFALALLPLMAVIGGFVDYSRAMRAKGQLAAATDAGILAAQLKYSLDSNADYQGILTDYLTKNLASGDKSSDIHDVAVQDVHVTEDGEMIAHVSGTVPMSFLSLMGVNDMTIGVDTAAKVGGSAIEVALVLDNTGSMQGSKLQALKTAATNLVNAIMIEEDDPKIKFALVPFTDYVKLDTAWRAEPGLDIPADYSINQHWCDDSPTRETGCTVISHEYDCGGDSAGQVCSWNEYTDCTTEPNPNYGTCYDWTDDFQWFGCMGSRPHDLNVRDADYGVQGVPGIMAPWDTCSYVNVLTRLTSKRADIISGLNQMQADGETYIPSGLVWGWRALSNEAPFSEGVPSNDKGVRKVIVLMTDGANTHSMEQMGGDWVSHHNGAVYGHWGGDTDNANQMTSEVCTNIKKADVMLYTISFDVAGDVGIQNLLQSCAGNGGQFYNADDEVQLSDAFRQIGLALLNLRLSK